MSSSISSELSLPSSLIGRLIGKGGETIQELEKLTECRISIPRRQSRLAADEKVCISIRCAGSRSQEETLKHETRCLRLVQLICLEALSVAESLAQADAERQAQEMIDEEKIKKEQENLAVQRVWISWPEFAETDIRAALRTTCDDEDAAIDLLLDGFRAQPEPRRCQASSTSVNHPPDELEEPREEYPRLCSTSALNVDNAPKSFTLGRTSRNAWVRKPEAKAMGEEFPSLPALKPLAATSVVSSNCRAPARMNRFTRHSRRVN